MKHLYRILFFFVLLFSVHQLSAKVTSSFLIKEKKILNKGDTNLAPPTATITTSTSSVCKDGSLPVITFTGAGGTAPYTFTYSIDGVQQPTLTTTSGNAATINVPTATIGSFLYTLISVRDASMPIVEILQNGSVTVTVTAPPVVDFTFIDNLCSGTAVQFTSVVVGSGPYTYLWDFGGSGTSSTSPNPSHIFNNVIGGSSQSFNVTLKVTDTFGCVKTISKVVTVKNPDASLNSSAEAAIYNGFPIFKVCTNDVSLINFINISTTNSTNTKYVINWGDSSPDFVSSTFSAATSHTYSVGLWTLTYVVTGQNGCAITKIYKVFVGNNPAVGIGNPGNTNICISTALTFPITGTENNPPGTIYTVTFNDDSVPTIFNHPPPASITHLFLKSSCGVTSANQQNSFSATIEASNPCDVSFGIVVPIRVSTPPIANFNMPKSELCTNSQICFTNESIRGSTATSASCIASKVVWIISPSTGFSLNSGQLGSDSNGSTNTNTWQAGTNSICPVFNVSGTYTITMKIGNGCDIDEMVKTICIESPFIPQFTLNTTEGCSPLNVVTTNSTSIINPCTPTLYAWEVAYASGFCGAAPAVWNYVTGSETSASPTFNFVTPGTYSIKLTMTNSCGPVTTLAKTVIVKQPPTVSINSIANRCQSVPITVINPIAIVGNCGIQTATYAWEFTGGIPATSTSATPSISYSSPGNYEIKLVVTNECGTTTATKVSFTINPTPTVDVISGQSKCKGQQSDAILFAGSIPNTVYNWTNNNSAIGLPTNGTGNINPFALINMGTTVLTATITVTPTLNGCTGTAKTFTIAVFPDPIVNDIASITLCNNANQNSIAFSPIVLGTTFSWTNSSTAIGLAASGTGPIPAFTASNTGQTTISSTLTVTPQNASGCTGTPKTFTITVHPTPNLQPLLDKEYCKGVATAVQTFSGAVLGTTYAWSNSNALIGLGASGTASIPSFVPANSGTTPITAVITVTPSANGCPGTPQTFKITVNPSPVVTFSPSIQTICSGNGSALVTLSSTTPSVIFNWTATVPAGITGMTTSGTDTIPVQVLSNSTATPILITYVATASLSGGASCFGAVFNYTIKVNPKPSITATINSTSCSSELFTTTPSNTSPNIIPSGTTYTWNIPTVTGGLSGGVSGTNASTISGTLTNLTAIPQTATYSVTPMASGCPGLPFDVVVTVNPKPTVHVLNNIILCAGQASTQIVFSGDVSGTTYNWSSTSLAVGLSTLSGSNDIPVFTGTNSGTIPITATITVTPSVNGCVGMSKIFTITVNPLPIVNTIANKAACNNQSSAAISFNGAVAGTTFAWTNDTPSIGLAASGTGNIGSFTALNTGTTPLIATVIVTPTANGCPGISKSFTITVNPTPTVEQPLNQEVCNGLSTVAIPLTGNIPSTTYSWTNSNSSVGLVASGSGTIPSFIGSNATSSPKIATITVTPSINGCPGTTKTFTITVNPSPVITFTPAPQTICSGENAAAVTLNSSTMGVTFSWTTSQPAGITETIATSGTNTIPAQTLTNTTNTDITIEYNATATVAGGGACLGALYTYTITVKPKPSITSPLAQTICSTTAFSITPVDGSGNKVPTGTIYTWSAAVISPVGAISGANAQNTPQSSISQTLVNVTDQKAIATYMVTPKSGTCAGTAFPVVITVNPSPKVVFSSVNQKICSGNDAAAINLSSPTTGSVTFNWTASIPLGITGATSSGTTAVIPIQTLTNTTAGPLTVIYTAKATLNDGVVCQGPPNTYSITVNPAIITSSVLSNYNGFNLSAVGANDGSIAVSVSGGSGSYTYSWSGPNSFLASSQNIANLIAGDYTLTINDGLCDPVILSFTLTAPQSLIIQEDAAAHANIFCNGYSTGSIKVVITQQSIGPYKYELILQGGGIVQSSLNNSALDYTFDGLVAGTYDIKVTDSNGSVKTIVGVIISQPSGITASISAQTNILCFGDSTGSATVTAIGGSGALTYSWNTIPIQTTPTASGLTAGTYVVTITDTNSCSTTHQAVITEPNRLVTSISAQTNILCFGNSTGTATIAVSGGEVPYAFSWNTLTNNTAATASGLSAGTYTVTVTDANNCTKVQQVTITQPTAVLESSISSFNNVSCFGGSDGKATVAVTNGSAPYTYSWNTVPVQTVATATGLTKGNYTVRVTDFNGCETTSAVTIEQPAAISTSISAQTNVACSGSNTGSATIVPNGGTAPYTFSWNTTPMQTTATGINLAKGTYSVTVVDGNNCSAIQQVVITEPNGLVTAIASQVNVDCFGKSTGSATVSVSGGTAPLTYSWDTATVNTTLSVSGLVAGSYHLTVSDANGCQKIQEVNITEPADLAITTNLEKDVTCFGDSDGAIKITVSGGTSVYSYSWTKDGTAFANTKDLFNLSPGIYQITVSDANNCGPKTATFTITEPPVLDVTFGSKTDIKCFGTATGAINVTVIGGTPSTSGYNFAWTGPNGFASASQNLIAVFAGTYNLIVTDNSGCTDRLTVILTQPALVTVSAITTPIVCYGDNDASIRLAVSGGVAPYTVLWSNLAVGIIQDNLSAGDYIATITDANNCIKTITVTIPEAPIFKMDPNVTQISCFGARDGSIKLNLVGGIPNVKLVWSDNSLAGTTRNNIGPGTYTATIIDGTPCQITKTFLIIEPQLLVLAANTTNALNCDDANSGAINLLVSGGTPPFSYTWSNGAVTEDLNAIPAGNYLVTVTDARKCSASGSYSVIRPAAIAVKVETVTDFNCETKVVKQSFIARTSGGVPPYQFVWSSGSVSGPNNEIMSTSQNGLVVLNAIDSRNCSTTYTFDVAIPQLGTPSFTTASIGYSTYGIYAIEDPIQFTNTATGDYTAMTWDFGDATFSTEENPTHIYKKEGTYIISQTVTYPFGCVYVHQINLEIEKGYRLIPPTGFTPNNDGINDYFAPVLLGLNDIHFDVYDTWGSLIYSESGENIRGWDGKINNKEGENGNYYFTITAKTFYGKKIKDEGALVLIN
ncbi:PKD-like domain-containing protein [Flavobacterium xanthum]|uniref:Gliding motility-associated C-terminal domain-containing protein n=1 Tax=Flavobacterium xanthum TaxID=69322 RepID=A0A1M6WY44_9FLAO|nr:PKD-like domain-containing protein [Flavobacterium xanthum]SHK98637.1 gliding motility-associated C-terminal domain-containing protein [Flavobacterium xanthum]